MFNPESLRHRAHTYMNKLAVMLLGAIFTLLFGILLILIHSIWVNDWRFVKAP